MAKLSEHVKCRGVCLPYNTDFLLDGSLAHNVSCLSQFFCNVLSFFQEEQLPTPASILEHSLRVLSFSSALINVENLGKARLTILKTLFRWDNFYCTIKLNREVRCGRFPYLLFFWLASGTFLSHFLVHIQLKIKTVHISPYFHIKMCICGWYLILFVWSHDKNNSHFLVFIMGFLHSLISTGRACVWRLAEGNK